MIGKGWKLPCPIRGERHRWITVGVSYLARYRRCQECGESRVERKEVVTDE